ncbi:MAG: dTMP kinase [Chloroflexi bacterium]|nr:MAG: dTMP kinase [Chloroflexota bacterium]
MSKGRLISFEGLDGAGKTTQMQLLEQWLAARDIPYIRTREPGAEAFLFQADRAQHFANIVIPALEAGKLVITDRCIDASIAYQGHARGVGIELVARLSVIATQGYIPNLTILLDLDPALVHARTDTANDASGLREQQTRFDAEEEQFHQRVREAFLVLARIHPQRIKVLDASLPPELLHEQIIALVEPLLQDM